MSSASNTLRISFPIIPVIYIVLIIAKLAGALSWSWLVVITSIIWMPILVFLISAVVIFLFALIIALISA